MVRVGELPGNIFLIPFKEGCTIKAALQSAGIEYKKEQVRLNGKAAELGTLIKDGDIILTVKKFKSNPGEYVKVFIEYLPLIVKREFKVWGDTIQDALKATGISCDNCYIIVNGSFKLGEDRIYPNDFIKVIHR